MIAQGVIKEVSDGFVTIVAPVDKEYLIGKQDITECEVRFDDGRTITAEQRKKAYALINDIAEWSGHLPEPLKEYFKFDYMSKTGCDYFSMSDCDMTTARDYISNLIDFCFMWSVPTKDTLLNRTDDIGKYLYQCLVHRKCAVCNQKADIHHVTGSRVGMGFNRNQISHLGRNAIALCRVHHQEAHQSERAFFDKYHLYGITLDDYLLKKLNL